MKTLLAILSLLAVAVTGLRRQFCTANVETASGTHSIQTMRADAALANRYVLVKAGSDAFHCAVAAATDYPIGSTTDTPGAAEDIVHVNPLGNSQFTRQLRCATALAANIDVYTAANGFVQALPGTAGTVFKVGRTVALAVQEGSNLFTVEVATCAPVKTLVIAAATGTAATDVAALFTALQSGPAEIKAL